MSSTITVREAALKLGVGVDWVYQLIWSGKIEAAQVGRTWKVDKASVEARLKQTREQHNHNSE